MAYKPGESGNPAGRAKGSKNKFTSLKDSFLDAFENAIGTEGLEAWIKKSERNKESFLKLVTKMLPTQQATDIKAKVDGEQRFIVEVVKVGGEEK